MDEKQKQILRFAQLAIKEYQGQGDFTQEDAVEVRSIESQLSMSRAEILAQATNLLVK